MTLIAVINFLLFTLITSYLGGDAFNGYNEDGQYYVTYRLSITEVSKLVWYIARIQGFSMIITHLGAFFCPLVHKPKNIPYKKLY